ncbi:MAG: bifunctional DNA-formamidopyrimidine glycosylase/DNA-(apurinic or apyrimidinic site) lyase [Lentisphaeria bacterium]
MPELPEVETITRSLQKHLQGATIIDSEVLCPLRHTVTTSELRDFCHLQTIAKITRRAKYILVHFQNSSGLLLHLGMTGSFIITPDNHTPDKHEHIYWLLADGRRWRFLDPRRFGSLYLIPDFNATSAPSILRTLGIEPLSRKFTAKYLWDQCKNHTIPIKNLIMDQTKIAGIGNIYANEALFASRIHPKTPANTLSLTTLQKLATNIKFILRDAIAAGGTTISDYKQPDGSEGHFKVHLQIYDRLDQPCLKCGTPIQRIKIGGRSSFFCPKCQKLKSQRGIKNKDASKNL